MKRLAVILILAATPALAQQQPDPAVMQKMMLAMQQQRNNAMDGQAQMQAQGALLLEENAKLKTRVEELEKAAAPAAAPAAK